ncbi:MAG: hypothetical protein HFJ50_07400 [Clostridia bacterium]|nr:hypothetical protein [Clostridia bacterium]
MDFNINNNQENSNNIDINNAFANEINTLKNNGFVPKVNTYKNEATGVTTVAIGLSQEGIEGNYILVKDKWNDNKWDMSILNDENGTQSNSALNLDTSLWLATHGLGKTNPNQICIEGLTIDEVLKLCEE